MFRITRHCPKQQDAKSAVHLRSSGWQVGFGIVLALTVAVASLAAPRTVAVASPAGVAKPGARPAKPAFAYDLVTALGSVYNFGGAGWYGNETWRHLAAPIVGIAATPDGRGYWLVGANGAVFNLGDAGWHGSLASEALGPGQQIISIEATRDGRGYWLVNQSGAVMSFGDAARINAGQPLPTGDLATPIVSAAIARGGTGAWFTDSAGHVYSSGDVAWLGSRVNKQSYPITSIAAFSSGEGYWLADAAGQVWAFFGRPSTGRPTSKSAPASAPSSAPGAAPASFKAGGTEMTGRLRSSAAGSLAGLSGTAVGITSAQEGTSYWVATSSGSVISGGAGALRPGTRANASLSAIVGIAAALEVEPPPAPSGAIGYDISWPQCASPGSALPGTLPGPPADAAGTTKFSIAVVGVDGWAVGDYNPCLSQEVAWAHRAVYPFGAAATGTPPYSLYMFLNSPAAGAPTSKTGPGGTCANLAGNADKICIAYNYGYNSAISAVNYAAAKGAQSNVWWLDIENDTCAPGMWNNESNGEWWSCDLSLNAETIQGAIDALRSAGITPGIYCTHLQWGGITGGYAPTGGAPLIWIAGAIWTSPPYPRSDGFASPVANSKYCTQPQYFFAGGKPVMLQETPGSTNYPYDPDIAC